MTTANSKYVTIVAFVGISSYCAYCAIKACGESITNQIPFNFLTKGSKFSPEDILSFWFGLITKHSEIIDQSVINQWFMNNKQFDEEIREKFGTFMVHVLNERTYDDWKETPKGCLALILIANQFTRKIYRGTIKEYVYDKYAQYLMKYAFEHKFDEKLFKMHPAYAQFLIMPLMLMENIEMQYKMIEKQKYLSENISKSHSFHSCVNQILIEFVPKNVQIIEEFGRFPERNGILQRESTESELLFIEKMREMKN